MIALAQAMAAPNHPGKVCGVLSDHADAAGLAYANENGIPTAIVERGAFASKADHEAAIHAALLEWDTKFIALAGFMRVLSGDFVAKWTGRIVNIHPSLLPKYKGLDTHARAIAAGDSEHGCSVHIVTPELDDGPIIAQARVPVLPDDTPETLAARVLVEEHRLYGEALKQLLNDR